MTFSLTRRNKTPTSVNAAILLSHSDNPLWALWALAVFHASFPVIYACSPVTQLLAQHVIYTLESFKIKFEGEAAYTVTLIMFN